MKKLVGIGPSIDISIAGEDTLGFQAQKVTFHGSPGLLENKLARLQYRQKEVQNRK